MAAVVTVSVAGRYLLSWPIPGDYDIVGILCGCAIFAFLPYCQLMRGNVLADFFTQKASARFKAILDAAANIPFFVAIVMFTWRLWFGMLELRQTSEQIAAFEFYRWWTIPFDIFCMVVLALVIVHTFLQDLAAAKAGKSAATPNVGGE